MQNRSLSKTLSVLISVTLLSISLSSTALATTQHHKAAITKVLKTYEQALNDSDVNKVLSVYAQDGVFMPSEKPTSVGHKQIKVAYNHVFKALDFNIGFNIDEIEWSNNLALVRTVSGGQIKLLQKNVILKNHTRELFVMKRINSKWKIYRYMFNQMSAAQH